MAGDNHPWLGEKPFFTASAFTTMADIDHWARGLGSARLDFTRRFFERKKRQGIGGLRVFDETTFWDDRDDNPDNDHQFFNRFRSTSKRMWNYNEIARRGPDVRPNRLTFHHVQCLLKLVELAREFDMRIELVVDATLKHSPGVGWDVIGHCIRQVCHFFQHLEKGKWIEVGEGEMGHPTNPEATARARDGFERVKGSLTHLIAIETHNEWDAHSRESWRDSYGNQITDAQLRAKALSEVNRRMDAVRRGEYWPGAAVWVSHGGRDTVEYDVRIPDAIAVHPSRPDMSVGSRFDGLLRHGKPAYANEIIHYIDPSMWWTVERDWFRPRSSTKDTEARYRFMQEMRSKGMWVCDHSLVGMANGHWIEEDNDAVMELDGIEKRLLADMGGTEPGPQPPPEPTPALRYQRIIAQAYQEILGRTADTSGLDHYNGSMAAGMSEAEMREALIRSEEYEEKNG